MLAELGARDSFSAGALEAFADCPVKWLVEKLLRPDALEPDPEPMVRGAYAHDVLEQTYRKLHEQTGSRRVTEANLPDAERLLVEAMNELQGEFRLSPTRRVYGRPSAASSSTCCAIYATRRAATACSSRLTSSCGSPTSRSSSGSP